MIATIILLGLLFVKLGIGLTECENGKDFLVKLITCGIMLTLYYYAGLFNNFI